MVPDLRPAVVGPCEGKAVVPQHVVTLVALAGAAEAHYLGAAVGSSPARFIAANYSTGKSFGAPHILHHVRIPRLEPKSTLHGRLAELSEAAARDDHKRVAEIEAKVDEAAAELWGLMPRELEVIQKALRDRKRAGREQEAE